MFLVENLRNDRIMVFDFVGLYMNQHADRSMQQNNLLIERRLKATELLLTKLLFSEEEKKILWAHTFHFCSVHAYLDGNRKLSMRYLLKAMQTGGMKPKWLMALIKYVAGRRWVLTVKEGRHQK